MSTSRRNILQILRLSVVPYFSPLLFGVAGDTLCGIVTVADAGDILSALRNKTFAAFRAECRLQKKCEACEIRSWSFVTEPLDPQEFIFILEPFSMPFRLNFAVKTRSDAWVALAEERTALSIFANINIGGNKNTRAVIRACDNALCPEKLILLEEQDFVSVEEYRPFWITYKGGVVTVGKGGQEEGFIEWNAGAHHGRVPTPVHIGIASWKIHPGEWVFFQNCS